MTTPHPRRARWARLGRLALLLALACDRPAPVEAEVPAAVDLAAVVLDPPGAGTARAGSRLVDWAPTRPLPVSLPPEQSAWVLGWSRAALPAGLGEPTELGAVGPVEGCAPRLPTPAWAARWDGERLVTVEPTTAPPLGADGLEQRCPEIDAEALVVAHVCRLPWCSRVVRRLDRCRFAIEGDGRCESPNAVVQILPDGRGCAELEGWRCEARGGDPGGGLVCDAPLACEVEVWAPPTPPAPFTLDRRRLGPETAWLPQVGEAARFVYEEQLESGVGHDLLPVADRLVVTTHDPPQTVTPCPDPSRPGRWWSLDADRLEIVATTTVPTCRGRLAAAPDDTVILVGGAAGRLRVERRDPDGSLLAGAELDTGLAPDAPRLSRARDVIVVGERVVVSGSVGQAVDRVEVRRLADLGFEGRADAAERLHLGEWFLDLGGRLRASSGWTQRVVGFDPATLRFGDPLTIPEDLGPSNQRFTALAHPASRRHVVLTAGARDVVLLPELGEAIERSSAHGPLFFLRAVVWPADPRLLLLVGFHVDRRAAVASLFDPGEARFLPGLYELGPGAPSRARVDARGRVWVLLPWAGEVVRLTPL